MSGLQLWQGPHVLAVQTPLVQLWHLVQVLRQVPFPSQVWHAPHLLLQTPFEQTWHAFGSQQPLPQLVCPAAHWVHTPLVQVPLAHSLPVTHCAPTSNVPGIWQDFRESESPALGSRQMGWTPEAVLQQSESALHR